MVREATITQEQVSAAANAIRAAGEKPTNRAVLEAVGSGSMATIVKFMQAWKASQARQGQAIGDRIDDEVIGAISNMLARKIEAATAADNIKLTELQNDLSLVIAENERDAATIAAQAAELASLRAQCQSQAGQIEALKGAAERARAQVEEEIQARESAQIALAKAELRIEALPALMEDVKQLRIEAKRASEEAAELRGKLAGLTMAKAQL